VAVAGAAMFAIQSMCTQTARCKRQTSAVQLLLPNSARVRKIDPECHDSA